ncbi:MAG: hypothetical protein QOJ73_2245, partial [Streptosporangiaceae bacterium]|nr:hypothetical protein [Streptosporangiaceae bacterium]
MTWLTDPAGAAARLLTPMRSIGLAGAGGRLGMCRPDCGLCEEPGRNVGPEQVVNGELP